MPCELQKVLIEFLHEGSVKSVQLEEFSGFAHSPIFVNELKVVQYVCVQRLGTDSSADETHGPEVTEHSVPKIVEIFFDCHKCVVVKLFAQNSDTSTEVYGSGFDCCPEFGVYGVGEDCLFHEVRGFQVNELLCKLHRVLIEDFAVKLVVFRRLDQVVILIDFACQLITVNLLQALRFEGRVFDAKVDQLVVNHTLLVFLDVIVEQTTRIINVNNIVTELTGIVNVNAFWRKEFLFVSLRLVLLEIFLCLLGFEDVQGFEGQVLQRVHEIQATASILDLEGVDHVGNVIQEICDDIEGFFEHLEQSEIE